MAHRSRVGRDTQIDCHLGFTNLGIKDRQLSTFLQQVLTDSERRRFPRVVRVGLERRAEHGDAFARHRAEQPLHHQPGDAVLLPFVERHHQIIHVA